MTKIEKSKMPISKRRPTKAKASKDAKDEVLRPRTAYNFFYRYQRDLILRARSSSPSNIENLTLPNLQTDQLWSFSTSRTKRPHRKTHGLISLQQLTKTVAKRWREADTETRNKFTALAVQDKIRYKNETRTKMIQHSFTLLDDHTAVESVRNKFLEDDKLPDLGRSNDCIPMRVESSSFASFKQEDRVILGVNSTYNATGPKIQSMMIPDYQGSSIVTPTHSPSTENNLSPEEYDMLDLLIEL